MFEKAKSGRDAFTFSLRGMTAIASFSVYSAIADDRINQIIDERLHRAPENKRDVVRVIEDFLASYFAPPAIRAT